MGGPTGEDVSTFDKMNYHIVSYATGKFVIVTMKGVNAGKRKIKIPKGYKEVKGVRSEGQPVFKKGTKYISPDATSHKGGYWKMADSPKKLKKAKSRMGTYNKDLTKKIAE